MCLPRNLRSMYVHAYQSYLVRRGGVVGGPVGGGTSTLPAAPQVDCCLATAVVYE